MVYFVPSLTMKSFHATNILANGRKRACDCLPAHLYIHEAACCHSHSMLTSWLLVRTLQKSDSGPWLVDWWLSSENWAIKYIWVFVRRSDFFRTTQHFFIMR